MLAEIHAHPRDAKITFFEEDHRYEVDGREMLSVTKAIGLCFPEFDADSAIQKMRATHPLYGKPPEEIKAIWEQRRDEASSRGTRVHEEIELFLNDGTKGQTVEFNCFHERYASRAKGKPYRTEWIIYDEEHGVAGTIDYVYTVGKHYCMTDWKRSKAIKKKNRWEKAFPPVAHLDNCNFARYCLQQNVYRLILKRNYGIDIGKMMLLQLYGDRFEPHHVPIMEEEAAAVLAHASQQVGV